VGDFRGVVTFCFFGARSLDGYGQIIATGRPGNPKCQGIHGIAGDVSIQTNQPPPPHCSGWLGVL
jgi:hypothetical protein